MYSQNETINLLDKNLISGSSEKQTLEIFSGFNRTTETSEPQYVITFSRTYINNFYCGAIPIDVNFMFYNNRLFKTELLFCRRSNTHLHDYFNEYNIQTFHL